MVTVRDFGRMDGIARDLRESPFPMELDLAAVPDGVYALETEVFDGETSLGAVRLGLVLQKGLDARLRALEAGAAAAPEALRAEIRYPGGDHTDVVVPNLPRVFAFLAAHRRHE